MAKARVRIVLDKGYLGQLLKSAEMGAGVEEAANRIATAAGAGYTVTVEQDRRKSRVIAMVMDLGARAMGREAATGNLARAVASNTESWVGKGK